MITKFLQSDSEFITKDSRQTRWAIPYHQEATNTRASVLLQNNIDLIKNNKILDLGCHFGTFSYICQKLGAKSTFGIDTDPGLIETANELFQKENIKNAEFIPAKVQSFIGQTADNTYDTTLCLGLLYYIPEQFHFLQSLKRITKNAIILDTFTAYYSVIQGKNYLDIIDKVKDESFELPLLFHTYTQAKKKHYKIDTLNTNKKKPLGLICCPTIPLLEMYFETIGYKYIKIDWSPHLKNPNIKWQNLISSEAKINSHWTDLYSANIRVSYLLKL